MASKRLSLKQIKLLRQHSYILKKLASSSARKRKIILENAPKELFIVLNLLFKLLADKRLNLSNDQSKKVDRHKKLIRTASGLQGDLIKRKLLKQQGGALSTILATILPVIGGIISSLT
jgi:hypothetical protein